MLTKNEITALSLSPTKKDFVQIWNELLEVAGKLSERWDPTSTNESDPGIVILKALTGIADKLNYNIDKNILEAFMPTAAQEDSMRKLCDMLGYNVKYYRSAETRVTIKYYNNDPSEEEEAIMKGNSEDGTLAIPKFTVITNSDQDISYFTTNQDPVYITSLAPSVTLDCMEGQVVKCESVIENNIITAAQISENNRFYLPEAQIAENGIFIYNVFSGRGILEDGTPWKSVDNLNIQARGTRIFKFGYDSYEGRPYVEFPSDYSELINDGLFIYYTRTSGANGNISPRTLTQLEKPSSTGWEKVSAESFSAENTFAATTGANVETIGQAYNNFKKTVGTFETLVTCRDYMNKIYTMTDSVGKPLVSNALVTDIRNDLNRAIVICSCDDAGIFYKETPLTEVSTKKLKLKSTGDEVEVVSEEPAMNYFDLVFYPFKSYNQIRGNVKDIQEVYDASFRYDQVSFNQVKSELEESAVKTIAHNIVAPRVHDVVCINNYLRLSAIIGTNSKITTEEGTLLKETIKMALANAFNMRELDFGEEIPFESIVEVIEKADARIKVVSLNEPALYTTFSVFEGTDTAGNIILKEYAVASDWLTNADADKSGRFDETTFNSKEAKQIYNRLAVRNVLAGRIPLFKYNNTFTTNFSESAYRVSRAIPEESLPTGMTSRPNADDPDVIYVDNNKQYTGKWEALSEKPDLLPDESEIPAESTTVTQKVFDEETCIYYIREWDETNEKPIYSKITYIEESIPEEYLNVIAKNEGETSNITEITTSCKILPGSDPTAPNRISNITLESGELIKFRAPNFITKKTYPAYVNYHLVLNTQNDGGAKPAQAAQLYSLLNNGDSSKWSEVFDYFGAKKKTFTLTQTVYVDDAKNTSAGLEIINPSADSDEKTPELLLKRSGCVKLCSGEPIISWADANEPGAPAIDKTKLALNLTNAPFITDANTFNTITTTVNTALKDETLQQSKDWKISYEFEYVPFDASTLGDWEAFVRQKGNELFGFSPKEDVTVILWRIGSLDNTIGKLVLSEGAKLLPFNSSYFTTLDSLASRLHGIYIVEYLGEDQTIPFIRNNEEYKLRDNEYLYIEYTPSTTEDSSQTREPVKEVYGPDTIIRPTGFEGDGLLNSSSQSGRSAVKTVSFENTVTSTTDLVNLYSLGVNEQIEIRDYAQVIVDKDIFAGSEVIYYYKNFNDCEALEGTPQYDEAGNRINNRYTLKDGEYIFYTDQNKTELAYFTTGTEVILGGTVRLKKCDAIDLATIFDTGLQAITTWHSLGFASNDSITFQEYQYITLGQGDTLADLTLVGNSQGFLNEQWQYCDQVKYIPAGTDTKSDLPKVNLSTSADHGCGWEASSILELNVSPVLAQTLRKTDTIETSVTLYKTSANGTFIDDPVTLTAEPDRPLSIKTNLTCQSSTGKVKISELYTNTENVKSFEIKVFSQDTPSIVKTAPNKLVSYDGPSGEETDSTGTFTKASYGDLWSQVTLTALAPVTKPTGSYDCALKLPVCIVPDTYGIFSIYLDYSSVVENCKTWLELPPGVSNNDVTLINVAEADIERETTPYGGYRLILKPGINCVKVNITCDIFIKTTADSDGVLYFDELRLVEATQAEYLDNGQAIKRTTNGLNLAQLGYLDVTEDDAFNIYDASARKKLKASYTDEALTVINNIEQSIESEQALASETITKARLDIQNIASFVTSTVQELSNLISKLDSETIITGKDITESRYVEELFINYINIYNNLQAERNLLAALNNNTTADDLNAELSNLLADFNDITKDQKDLLAELQKLRSSLITNVDTIFNHITDDDILEDFRNTATAEKYGTLLADLKQSSLSKINTEFSKTLNSIKTELENIDNKEITAILNRLYQDDHDTILNDVDNITSFITTTQAKMQDALASIEIAAYGELRDNENYIVDYSEVATHIIALRDLVQKDELYSQLTRLEADADASRYTEFLNKIGELKLQLQAKDSDLISTINALLLEVQAKVNSNSIAPAATIQAKISLLRTKISDSHTARLNDLLAAVAAVLSSIQDSYTTIIDDLNKSQDDTIKTQAANLNSAVTTRSTDVATLNSADLDAYTDATSSIPFSEEAILSIWPNYMKFAFVAGINKLSTDVRAAIKNLNMTASGSNLPINDWFYTANNTDRVFVADACISSTDVSAVTFTSLFTSAKAMATDYAENTARQTEIEKLTELILDSSELTLALADIADINDSARNAVICGIVAELKTGPTVTRKQQLLIELKEELARVISIDNKLAEVSAKLLCPSILLLGVTLPEVETSAFYINLRDKINEYKSEIAAITVNNEEIDKDLVSAKLNTMCGYFSLRNTDITMLLSSIIAGSVIADIDTLAEIETLDSLLPVAYLDNLNVIKSSVEATEDIADIKNCKLLELLTQDLVVAWETVDGKWTDSAGNYYRQYDDESWADDNGYWLTHEGRQVKVILKRIKPASAATVCKWLYAETNAEVTLKGIDDKWLGGGENASTIELDKLSDTARQSINAALAKLLDDVTALGQAATIPESIKDIYTTIKLEEQLLAEIRAVDTDRHFYYNVPIETVTAIDFNESDSKLNTLMNPSANYDINNVNNNFVISKLDINYLTNGIQIARSSRIS